MMTNQSTIRKIRKALRLFERELDRFKGEQCCSGVTFKQCHTILAIEDEKSTNISELSNILNLDKSTISRTVDSLVNLKLIDRIIPEGNRRCTVISLTKKGAELCDSINKLNDNFFSTVFEDFSKDDINQFASFFERTSQNMLKYKQRCECTPKESNSTN